MHLLFILTLIYAENINLPNPINSQPKEENKTEQKENDNPSQQSKESKEPSKPEPKGNDNLNQQQKEGSKNESKGFDLFSQQNKENKPKGEENKAAQPKNEENKSTQSKSEENKSSSVQSTTHSNTQSMSQSSAKPSIQSVSPLSSSSVLPFPSVSQSMSATSSISSSDKKQSDKSLTESKKTEKMPGEQISSKEIQENSSKENKEESSAKKDKKCLEMDLNMPIKFEIKISPKDLKNIKSIESMLKENKQEDSKKVLDPENKKEENQPEKEELVKSLQPNQSEMSLSPSDKKNESSSDKKSESPTDKKNESPTEKKSEPSSDKQNESSSDKQTTPEKNDKIETGLKLFCALIKNVDLIKEKIKPFFQVNKILIFKNDKNEFMDYWGRFKFTKQNDKFLDETGFFVGEEKESLAQIVENGKLTKIGFYQNKNITQQESENDLKNVQDLLKKVAEEKKVKIEDLLNEECPLSWVDKMLFEKEFNKNNQPVQVVVCVKKEGEDNCESLVNK